MKLEELIQLICQAPPDEAGEILRRLPDEQAAAIKARLSWLKTARKKQLPPDGDWVRWIYIAGRGAGKTRTAAEWAWWESWKAPGTYTHVIAPTWDSDVIGVAFQGPSGLLSVCPRDLIADWNKGDAILSLTNGSIIRGFSGEKPDRLRGPQCLIADTLVTMGDGTEKRIADVCAGDFVATRCGPRRVMWSGMTDRHAELWRVTLSNGRTIVGTGDHPVWTVEAGFVPLSRLKVGAKACAINVSSGEAIRGTPTEDITTSAGSTVTSSGCIERNTSLRSAQSQTAITSITKTKISSTTTSPTSKPFLQRTTPASTPRLGRSCRERSWPNDSRQNGLSLSGRTSHAPNAAPRSNLAPGTWQHHSAPFHVRINGEITHLLASRERASNAPQPTGPQSRLRSIAAEPAISGQPWRAPAVNHPDCNARIAGQISSQGDRTRDSALATAPCLTTLEISSVERLAVCAPVYDLTVEDQHEFFANGVLVHNCHRLWCDEAAAWQYLDETWDMAMFGTRLGDDIRIVATTTPKAKPLIVQWLKEGDDKKSGTVVTRGTTYENRDNLAKQFFDDLVKRYEGTTIGRQELLAEVIDPAEMGIIKKSWIKLWPANQPLPAFRFIVLSLDTAYTERTRDKKTGETDYTACSVWGLFAQDDRRDGIMLLDCWQDKLGMPQLIERIPREMGVKYGSLSEPMIRPVWGKPLIAAGEGRKPDLVIIEDIGSGKSLRQMLEVQGVVAWPYNPGNAKKVERLHAVSHLFFNGLVFVPESSKRPGEPATWANEYAGDVPGLLDQVCMFSGEGSIKHDDYVDSTTQALRYLADRDLVTAAPRPEYDEAVDEWRSRPRANPYASY